MTDKPRSTSDAKKRRDVQARSQKLGQQLQSLYKEVAEEPIPDEFLKLLEQADDAADDENGDD